MTISTTTSLAQFTGDASTTVFPFTFPSPEEAAVKVYLDNVLQGSGYTVALNADQVAAPGGTITFLAAPETGVAVLVQRELDLTQATSLSAYSPFPAKTLERALDRLVMQQQQFVRDDPTAAALSSAAMAASSAGSASVSATIASDSASAAVASASDASASMSSAQTAQAAAELARDAATATGKMYASTAAAQADGALAAGAFYSVPVSGSTTAVIIYRKDSGAASTEMTRMASEALVTDLIEVVPNKNLYDPSLAVNGSFFQNADGQASASANYARSGLIPVTEGNTYTLSSQGGAFSDKLHFYGAGGITDYKGGTTAGYPAGVTATWTAGGLEWHFNVPAASGITHVGTNIISGVVHTVGDFDTMRNGMQLELGALATAFVAYTSVITYVLKESKTPPALESRVQAVENAVGVSSTRKLGVTKLGTSYYLRCAFDDTNDLVIVMVAGTNRNNVSQWTTTFLMPVAAADSEFGTYNTGSYIIHSPSDDPAPVRLNGTTVGANHGWTQFVVLTAAAHGKTTADIGSRWQDGASKFWTIISVPSTSSIWVMSDYTKSGDVPTFTLTETGNLTHVSGAVHTTTITPSSRSTSQLGPSVQWRQKAVMVDGVIDIASSADASWTCDFLEFVNEYDITDVADVLDYIKAHPGVATAFDDPGIAACARLSVVLRVYPNGSTTVFHTVRALKQVTISDLGFVQGAALNQVSGRRLYEYIPGVLPITPTVTTFNFKNLTEITTGLESCYYFSTHWADANRPPSRMAQVLRESNGTTPVAGFQLAYHLEKGATVPSTRKDAVNGAIDLRSTQKNYPIAVGGPSTDFPLGDMPAGTYLEVVAFRSYWSPAVQPLATVAHYVEDGAVAYLFLDYHQATSFDAVALPAKFRGRQVTAVESDGVTVHTTVVGPDGVLVTVSGTYGSAVLKLA